MTAERAELIARIRKLRERARVDRGREGLNARRLASELMERHGITAADLTPPRPPRPAERPVSPPSGPPYRRPAPSPARRKVPLTIDLDIGGFKIRGEWEL